MRKRIGSVVITKRGEQHDYAVQITPEFQDWERIDQAICVGGQVAEAWDKGRQVDEFLAEGIEMVKTGSGSNIYNVYIY